MPEHPDVLRVRAEYAKRALGVEAAGRYSLLSSPQLFTVQQRQRVFLECLRRNGLFPLSRAAILELGCGSGGVLLELLGAGAKASNLHGTDLLMDRAQAAHATLQGLALTCADGQDLPYAPDSFDLTLQFTVFSSLLDGEVKAKMAREMLRVTRPQGLIIWYDFWLNPTNPQTRGIRPPEIRRLFSGCDLEFHKITLAPPLARRLVPASWILSATLEKLGVFNSHYLVAIHPTGKSSGRSSESTPGQSSA